MVIMLFNFMLYISAVKGQIFVSGCLTEKNSFQRDAIEDLQPHRGILFLWRKVYDHQPHDQTSLWDTVNAECLDISAKDSFPGVLQERT